VSRLCRDRINSYNLLKQQPISLLPFSKGANHSLILREMAKWNAQSDVFVPTYALAKMHNTLPTSSYLCFVLCYATRLVRSWETQNNTKFLNFFMLFPDETKQSGYITVGYRGTFAFGRDGMSDVKFRKLARIIVCGRVALCREVSNST